MGLGSIDWGWVHARGREDGYHDSSVGQKVHLSHHFEVKNKRSA